MTTYIALPRAVNVGGTSRYLPQAVNVVQPDEIPVKCRDRQVSGFSGDLEYQAIGEIDRRPRTIVVQCRGDYFGVLKG